MMVSLPKDIHVKTETWGELHVKMEDWSEASTSQGMPQAANNQKLTIGKEGFPDGFQWEQGPANTLIFRLPRNPKELKRYISIVLSHPICVTVMAALGNEYSSLLRL